MTIIVTNDDGIDAPGLAALERIAGGHGDVVIVAPDREASGVSHSTTLHDCIDVTEVAPRRFAVSGTPADCVRIGLTAIAPDADLVLSGINRGGNLGVDTYLSGTVAAAREAAFLGRAAVALSQYVERGRAIDWALTGDRAAHALGPLVERRSEGGTFWNVNLPHPHHAEITLDVVHCPVDPSPLDVRYERDGDAYCYKGVYQERPRRPEHDVEVCFGGRIAVSCIAVQPRHYRS